MTRVSHYLYKGLETAVIYLLQIGFHSHAEITVDYDYKASIINCFILPRTLFAHVYLSRMHKQK